MKLINLFKKKQKYKPTGKYLKVLKKTTIIGQLFLMARL